MDLGGYNRLPWSGGHSAGSSRDPVCCEQLPPGSWETGAYFGSSSASLQSREFLLTCRCSSHPALTHMKSSGWRVRLCPIPAQFTPSLRLKSLLGSHISQTHLLLGF